MMSKLENMQQFDYTPFADETDQQALERYDTQEMAWCHLGVARALH